MKNKLSWLIINLFISLMVFALLQPPVFYQILFDFGSKKTKLWVVEHTEVPHIIFQGISFEDEEIQLESARNLINNKRFLTRQEYKSLFLYYVKIRSKKDSCFTDRLEVAYALAEQFNERKHYPTFQSYLESGTEVQRWVAAEVVLHLLVNDYYDGSGRGGNEAGQSGIFLYIQPPRKGKAHFHLKSRKKMLLFFKNLAKVEESKLVLGEINSTVERLEELVDYLEER